MSNVKKIEEELKWHIEENKRQKLIYSWLSYNFWYLIEIVTDKFWCPKIKRYVGRIY